MRLFWAPTERKGYAPSSGRRETCMKVARCPAGMGAPVQMRVLRGSGDRGAAQLAADLLARAAWEGADVATRSLVPGGDTAAALNQMQVAPGPPSLPPSGRCGAPTLHGAPRGAAFRSALSACWKLPIAPPASSRLGLGSGKSVVPGASGVMEARVQRAHSCAVALASRCKARCRVVAAQAQEPRVQELEALEPLVRWGSDFLALWLQTIRLPPPHPKPLCACWAPADVSAASISRDGHMLRPKLDDSERPLHGSCASACGSGETGAETHDIRMIVRECTVMVRQPYLEDWLRCLTVAWSAYNHRSVKVTRSAHQMEDRCGGGQAVVLSSWEWGHGGPRQRCGGSGGGGGGSSHSAPAGRPHLPVADAPGAGPPAGGGYAAGPRAQALARHRCPGDHHDSCCCCRGRPTETTFARLVVCWDTYPSRCYISRCYTC